MHSFPVCKPLLYEKSNHNTPIAKHAENVKKIMSQLDKKLLEILVCPLTKGPLRYDPARQELVSEKAKLAYPIRDGIPIMLSEEARHLEENA